MVSPEGPPWLELRGQDNLLCVFYPLRILDNAVINLQKGRKNFSIKIPTICKYFKIVKIAVNFFKHTKSFRVFGKHKAKKIKVEYFCCNNFLFLEIKTLEMLDVRSHSLFWNTFLKFSGKHLWCSPNISRLFNRPLENRFNNRQYTTHTEQFIDALSQFMCLYLLYQNGFFTICGNPQKFWLHRTTLLGKPLMERSWVFS